MGFFGCAKIYKFRLDIKIISLAYKDVDLH
jgi:hypothetical protein